MKKETKYASMYICICVPLRLKIRLVKEDLEEKLLATIKKIISKKKNINLMKMNSSVLHETVVSL